MKVEFRRDLSSSAPLYRQVETHLRERIQSGNLQPGDMLPTVRELCEQFGGINHLTVRQAIKNLAEEQLVRSVQGKGTFVSQANSRRRAVALVLPNLEDYFFLHIARGVQNELDFHGVRTLILDSRGSWDKEAENIHHLRELPLDGALIFPITHHDIAEQIFKMKMEEFPFVLIDRYFEDIETPSIVADNYQGGYDLTKALIERGRRNFAWIGELSSSSARLRLQGFRDALNDRDLTCPRDRILTLEIPPASSHASYIEALQNEVQGCVERILKASAGHAGTAQTFVFANDQTALIAMRFLQERGLRIPDDIAMCGFDDRPEAAQSTPPLTTVRQPMVKMGHEAACTILARMGQANAPIKRCCLPVEIVLRESA
jgi:DNA-binding LacI/PurR family transcriptional regulator